MVTPLIRKSLDVGLFANKSRGKTMVMVALSFFYFVMGYTVFSNIRLKFPHIYIDSLVGLQKLRTFPKDMKKVFIAEDFERWVNSRNAREKMNVDIAQICIDFGKMNCNTIYTSKRPMAIDISLRDTTDIFCEVCLKLLYRCKTGNKKIDEIVESIWSDDLEMLKVVVEPYDVNLKPLPLIELKNLVFYGSLYDTQEIIGELSNVSEKKEKQRKYR